MRIFVLLFITIQTVHAFLSPWELQTQYWMRKLDCVDDQMLTLLQKRLELVERLDKSTNYSYDYRNDRDKIEKLTQRTKPRDQPLVDSMWTLIGNHARHQNQIIKKK